MGDHDAAGSWLDRWRDQEPVRLYLWGIAGAVVPAAVLAGWLTSEVAVAITGVLAALLMIGGASAARSAAYSPATVHQLQARWEDEQERELEEQHTQSWEDGWDAGTAAIVAGLEQTERTPEQVAAETRAMRSIPPCGHVENGRRCLLAQHPDTVPHRLEEGDPAE